jgi:hypothetical protein
MSRCEDIVQNKEGKLLTNLTIVIVDVTIRKTTLVRAAEHPSLHFLGLMLSEYKFMVNCSTDLQPFDLVFFGPLLEICHQLA